MVTQSQCRNHRPSSALATASLVHHNNLDPYTPRPQAAAQGFLVAQLEPGDQSWLMIASIIGCIVSIAYLVATTELDLDTSPHYRLNWPMVHGY